jgi:hypothetical protein
MDGALVCQLSRQAVQLGSELRIGEPLKASKRETDLKMRLPHRPLEDDQLDRSDVEGQ